LRPNALKTLNLSGFQERLPIPASSKPLEVLTAAAVQRMSHASIEGVPMGWLAVGVLAVIAILICTLGGGWSAIGLVLLFVAAFGAVNRYEFGRVD
jgi:hypothetical protein